MRNGLKRFSFMESLKIHNNDLQSVYFNRPNFKTIISDIDNSTNVFYCESKRVGNIIHKLCNERHINYSLEMFDG